MRDMITSTGQLRKGYAENTHKAKKRFLGTGCVHLKSICNIMMSSDILPNYFLTRTLSSSVVSNLVIRCLRAYTVAIKHD